MRLADGSLAARAAGEEHHETRSHHHQGVDRIGEGLQVSGWSGSTSCPRPSSCPTAASRSGVQWHPEADPASRLIAALVAEAAAARAAR